ncbi:response regulator transcription factor [Calidifontibacter sp. DB0510]|uniref:Response regulator transcription factor n=1 Tax=Metallococcus carri TaxID=1656884 RepID=A0A967EHU4_9MICO|nr:response regulator transcription factor [Metallococcus carri]NHN57108.1 response regulator transcription factor [Metallococcus carri]NOP39023.1 response regulator transcription factor [Calidifontibacter sp. DB2511S]
MIKVLLVDDDPLLCAGLRLMLGAYADLEVVGEAHDGDEAAAAVRTTRPDVVLLDVRMPRQDGIETTRQLRRLPGPPRIIMLTTWDTDELVVEAINAGADGFLLKADDPDRIAQAIRDVYAGRGVLTPAKVPAVFDSVARAQAERSTAAGQLAALSPREREVVIELARGGNNAEIGGRLFLSEATVKTHLQSAQRKLGVTGRVELAVLVAKAGLV